MRISLELVTRLGGEFLQVGIDLIHRGLLMTQILYLRAKHLPPLPSVLNAGVL